MRRGQTLVVVEGNESMRSYAVTAPFDGVVLTRSTNVGDVAGDNTLIEMADLIKIWVELHMPVMMPDSAASWLTTIECVSYSM